MTDDRVLFDVDSDKRIATITFNNPAQRNSYDAAMRDTALLRQLDVPTPTLEGYLFPDTYALSRKTGAPAALGASPAEIQAVARRSPNFQDGVFVNVDPASTISLDRGADVRSMSSTAT